MNFKAFIETINYDSRDVIIKKGEILYHGTLESYDTRKITTSGYDDIFWTTDVPIIARTYIPANGLSLNTSVSSIIRDEQHKNIRKSLGLTDNVIRKAWQIQEKGYKNLKHWDEEYKSYTEKFNQLKQQGIDDPGDEFFQNWIKAENEYKKVQREWKTTDQTLAAFVVHKMKAFGYEPSNKDYFTRILQDKDGHLLPAKTRDIGKVLKLTCNRDFKVYNYAYGKEGDLMDVDYRKFDMFRLAEKNGYDGIIINDYTQSEYHGNYGHRSIGFFKKSLKDLSVKQIRNQTHPSEEDWKSR